MLLRGARAGRGDRATDSGPTRTQLDPTPLNPAPSHEGRHLQKSTKRADSSTSVAAFDYEGHPGIAMQPVFMQGQSVPATEGVQVIQSAEDKREYRYVTLPNGMAALLIHDPKMLSGAQRKPVRLVLYLGEWNDRGDASQSIQRGPLRLAAARCASAPHRAVRFPWGCHRTSISAA